MNKMDLTKIGKDVIETLTQGMYEDCRFIYREYIQNSADQIDKAIAEGLVTPDDAAIYVNIDSEKNCVEIEDNATGVSKDKVIPILRNIAYSTKRRGEDKGFRGIGRLGGLGYCSELIFETSYKGENVCTAMTWNASLLRSIINDREKKEEAADVINKITKVDTRVENIDSHYFKVILKGVQNKELLNIKGIRDYLSMVAPIDFNNTFRLRKKIYKYIKDNNIRLDTYHIFVNKEEIFKQYFMHIYEDNNGGKKAVDDILEVKFLESKDENNNMIYWGWYTLSHFLGQMKQMNIARGIRLRKDNIQIGDEEICKKFFDKTDNQRFSFYFFGEIHAVSKDLIPNSRRDYFSENEALRDFETRVKQDFLNLRDICYDASALRKEKCTIEKAKKIEEKVEENDQKGYLSSEDRDSLYNKQQGAKRAAGKAKETLKKLTNKIKTKKSPLAEIIDQLVPNEDDESKEDGYVNGQVNVSEENTIIRDDNKSKKKYRTDDPKYSRYTRNERKLIGRIYAAIRKAIPEEQMREALIKVIENDLTK